MWGATSPAPWTLTPAFYFNPRTPCGVRQVRYVSNLDTSVFQSTHPVWGATQGPAGQQGPKGISIHAPRVGCDLPRTSLMWRMSSISIHAPRVGCDAGLPTQPVAGHKISIHAPRVGCDYANIGVMSRGKIFQSTHPVWGATAQKWERRSTALRISIHAPRVGCDVWVSATQVTTENFNPRTPCGVRRPGRGCRPWPGRISIHAPRVGCDWA